MSWVLDWLKTKPERQAKSKPGEAIPKGERNHTLTSMAGTMRRAGMSAEEITIALAAINQRRCTPPLSEREVRQIAQSIGRYEPAKKSVPYAATVNLGALSASIEVLNALEIFGSRIRFQSLSRRGPMILATTVDGGQIIWPTMTDLTSFGRARAAIADGADVLLPQPKKGDIAKVWDPAADLIIRLSALDAVRVEHVLKAECKDLLVLMWRYAKQPTAADSKEFAVKKAVRDREHAPPPCVFLAEEYCWVHVPTFRNWISMPALTNRLYPLENIRQGLLLLGFKYQKDVTRGAAGDSESTSLWRGPMDVLVE